MAIYKNKASQKMAVFAYDSTDGSAKTGDAAQITAQISKDGAATAATDDTNPTELDATDAPGVYIFDLTQAETNADLVVIAPVSSTSDILLEPLLIYTQPEIRKSDLTQIVTVAQSATDLTKLLQALLLVNTTIASDGRSTTSCRLTAGSAVSDDYIGGLVVLDGDEGAGTYVARTITDYNLTNKVLTWTPAIAHDAVDGGNIYIIPGSTVLPSAAPGAANGIFIAGTNAPVTITSAAGTALTISSTGTNGNGIAISGNGTGEGVIITGGATGNGIEIKGGATSGKGAYIYSQNNNDAGLHLTANGTGSGLLVESAGAGIGLEAKGGSGGIGAKIYCSAGIGYGLHIEGSGAAGHAMYVVADTAGNNANALHLVGGNTGCGIYSYGGSSGGCGVTFAAQANANGLECNGIGAGAGIKATGGNTAVGNGMLLTGGTGFSGLKLAGGTDADALELTPNGSGVYLTAAAVTQIQAGLSTHSAADVKTAIEAEGSSIAQILEDTDTTIPGTITTMTNHLTDIKGTGFAKNTHSLPQCLTATSVTVSDKTGFSLVSTGLDLVTTWTTNITGTVSGNSTHSAADVKTAIEANGSKLDHLWEMTEDDGGIRRFTENSLEEAPSGGASADDIADAVLDELITEHLVSNSLGAFVAAILSGRATLANQTSIIATLGAMGSLGDGSESVDHDYGGADNMKVIDAGGSGVDNVVVRAYLKTDYDAGNRGSSYIKGTTVTNVSGEWFNALRLDPAVYTIEFSKQGSFQTNTKEITVT